MQQPGDLDPIYVFKWHRLNGYDKPIPNVIYFLAVRNLELAYIRALCIIHQVHDEQFRGLRQARGRKAQEEAQRQLRTTQSRTQHVIDRLLEVTVRREKLQEMFILVRNQMKELSAEEGVMEISCVWEKEYVIRVLGGKFSRRSFLCLTPERSSPLFKKARRAVSSREELDVYLKELSMLG